MSWPYIAKDRDGWYADAEGVMSDSFKTKDAAYEWAIDRLAHALGVARHGCLHMVPTCLLHEKTLTGARLEAMRQQLLDAGQNCPLDAKSGRIIRQYEAQYLTDVARHGVEAQAD